MSEEVVKSPCISVCALNMDNICEGCYRTAQEITLWSGLSNTQKKAVLSECKARFQRMNTIKLL